MEDAMQLMRLIALSAVVTIGLSACSLLNRDPRSGYAYDEETTVGSQDLYKERAAKQEMDAREELGMGSKPLTEDERVVVENRLRLKRLESKLASKRDKKQYYNVRSGLKNDRERIAFLSLPTYEARERWAAQRGLGDSEETFSEEIAKTVESNDIALGMSQKAVMQSWGDPDAVEVAGNPLYGYERWRYNRYISGNEGYQKDMRIVYFEGGRVVGWERP
jgi:primase-polymerase (primpol)-like protein